MHSINSVYILTGLMINIIITLGGFVKIAVIYEHRFTKLETEIEFLRKELHHG